MLGFMDPLQNHFLFHQSPVQIVHILEITSKVVVCIGYQSWRENKNIFYQLGMKLA